MEKVFNNKIALVTGGGSGIGRATAVLFARQGAKVVIANRRIDKGEETVKIIKDNGGEAIFIQTDISIKEQVENLIIKIVEKYGILDCAFNCGGVDGIKKEIIDLDETEWDEVININLRGTYLLMKYEIKQMIKQNYGSIVNMSSISAYFGRQGRSSYNTSRLGVIGLTRTAAMEYAKYGIRINAIGPGAINTVINLRSTGGDPKILDLYKKLSPLNRLGEPEEVGEAVLWLCSDKASFVIGHVLMVDGGAKYHR